MKMLILEDLRLHIEEFALSQPSPLFFRDPMMVGSEEIESVD